MEAGKVLQQLCEQDKLKEKTMLAASYRKRRAALEANIQYAENQKRQCLQRSEAEHRAAADLEVQHQDAVDQPPGGAQVAEGGSAPVWA